MKKELKDYFLDESEMPHHAVDVKEGEMAVVQLNTTKEEQSKYLTQCRVMEGICHTVFNLFQIENIMEWQVTTFGFSMDIIQEEETSFNPAKVIESPWLSRRKLIDVEPRELSKLIIDMVRNRDKWDSIKYYRKLNIQP